MDSFRRPHFLLPAVFAAALATACGPPRGASPSTTVATLPRAPKRLELLRTETAGTTAGPAPLLVVLGEELGRNMKELAKVKDRALAPYFVAYEALDERSVEVEASFGKLVTSASDRSRSLDVDVRVGAPKV